MKMILPLLAAVLLCGAEPKGTDTYVSVVRRVPSLHPFEVGPARMGPDGFGHPAHP
jgi:hypothetical protein